MELKAIATKYDGIVFRSRLEAIFYRYIQLQNQIPGLETLFTEMIIEYEPDQYKIDGWSPDFLTKNTLNIGAISRTLIEVKPTKSAFCLEKYLPAFAKTDVNSIWMVCPEVEICIDRNFQVTHMPIIEEFYKQASNDVYYHIKNG